METLDRLRTKLSSSGIPFDGDIETSHGGHTWEYFNHMADQVVPWLADALKHESLRA
jgi:S-formylglutathione hydrolase FrmB